MSMWATVSPISMFVHE